jgi:hypothetical protein
MVDYDHADAASRAILQASLTNNEIPISPLTAFGRNDSDADRIMPNKNA